MLKKVFQKRDKRKIDKQSKSQPEVLETEKAKNAKHSNKPKQKRSKTHPVDERESGPNAHRHHQPTSHSKKKSKVQQPQPSKTEKRSRAQIQFGLKDLVLLTNRRRGIIRYLGEVHFARGEWIGIELTDSTVGNHDGKVGSKRYFRTLPKAATFVSKDQIKQVLRKYEHAAPASSASTKHSKLPQQQVEHSRKKKKKSAATASSNSLKRFTETHKHDKPKAEITARPLPSRPKSAKLYTEFFPDEGDEKRDSHGKRPIPPPPPLPILKSDPISGYSNSSSKSRTMTENLPALTGSASASSMPVMRLPLYQLQSTLSSNISAELSPINDERYGSELLSPINGKALPIRSKLQKPVQRGPLKLHHSYNGDECRDRDHLQLHSKTGTVIIRKYKSQGEVNGEADHEDDEDVEGKSNNQNNNSNYGLALEGIYAQFNLNDPAVQQLKQLQKSMRQTQLKSMDLQDMLSASPPSIPPTPTYDRGISIVSSSTSTPPGSAVVQPSHRHLTMIVKHDDKDTTTHELQIKRNSTPNSPNRNNNNNNNHSHSKSPRSKFQFKRERSLSDPSQHNLKPQPYSYKKRAKTDDTNGASKKRNPIALQSKPDASPNPSEQSLRTEAEDTDVEEMYVEYPATNGGDVDAHHHHNDEELKTMDSDDEDDQKNGNEKQTTGVAQLSRARSKISLDTPRYDDNDEAQRIDNAEVQHYIEQNFRNGDRNSHKSHNNGNVTTPNNNGHAVQLSPHKPNGDLCITPRACGTDAFSRIRSRSIQNKLSQQHKYGTLPHAAVYPAVVAESQEIDFKHNELLSPSSSSTQRHTKTAARARKLSIKFAGNVCPFWNPFEQKPHCPYQDISGGGGGSTEQCSLKHLTKSQFLDQMNEDDIIELLTVLFCESSYVEACIVIEKLLTINADNDEYNTCFADILEELGRYEEAEKYYRIALRINPRYDDAYNNYGMMLFHKLARVGDAEQEYRKCLSITPMHQVCHTNYAKLLQHASRFKEAEYHFKQCLAVNEANVNCQHYYGVFLYELGRWSEAKYHLQKAIELNDCASYRYNLGKLLCDLKEFHEAEQQLQQCLKLEPDNVAFNFEYALFLAFDLKDVRRSIQYFAKAYMLDPHDTSIQQKYDEIAGIVAEQGLSVVKRRRSSARMGGVKRQKRTIVEYKAEEEEQNGALLLSETPTHLEFARFLQGNLSVGSCMNDYLQKFQHLQLNDIRCLKYMDLKTLMNDVNMNAIHAQIMMSQIEKFKQQNIKFSQWLSSIALQEYMSIFEQNGILTFESFYHHITTSADLTVLLGDRNAFDVELIWQSCPRCIRHKSVSNGVIDNENDASDGAAETEPPHPQIEGKQNGQ